jgi:hypothetical protein
VLALQSARLCPRLVFLSFALAVLGAVCLLRNILVATGIRANQHCGHEHHRLGREPVLGHPWEAGVTQQAISERCTFVARARNKHHITTYS